MPPGSTAVDAVACAFSTVTSDRVKEAAIEPAYVDDRELERRTPIRRITWQTWRRHRFGPPVYRIGRRCIYRWAEVVAWIEAHRVGGAAAGGAAP